MIRRFCLLFIAASCAAMFSCNRKTDNQNDSQQLYVGENIAVAETEYGKVRGYILRNIYQFKGIPYGASTAGKNRFMPPQKPESWEGIRPVLNYGDMAPQAITYDRSPESASGFVDNWNFFNSSEDCLRLNVWTPALDRKKRPVLVWFHGGGFFNGNAIEQDGYGGENFSKYGDVVVCSVNHRLNAFGFTDLSKVGGDKYRDSGNVGILDLIAALKWINRNIKNFGGDPGNVTIMGQSGGGSKVSIIATMPAAKGLVHKAVALSGNNVRAMDKKISEKLGEYIVKEAGLKTSEIDKLQEMPWEDYYELANTAAKKFNIDNKGSAYRGFSPVGDNRNIPSGTFFDPTDSDIPDIPMMYCTVKEERNPNRDKPELEDISLNGVIEKLKPQYGDNADIIVHAYASSFPKARPIEVWGMLTGVRSNVVRSANVKSAQKSPVYMAWFTWQPPLFDGRLRAFHCLDICFWLHNTDVMLTHTGGGKRPMELSNKMSDALLAFMHNGNPNCKSLPNWPEYTPKNGEVMIFDDNCIVKNDPDRKARKVLEKIVNTGTVKD
ncbi:carboxylesterase/lipase family protein [Bacteroides uniformis]|uniref:carboxylesterase/lipase family protein n=1 Tax=Bacteroides uniformis TaxID=820 RepID=UPI0018986958|nr:carboxylesterase family protein [Bacteroides uniformis]